MWDEHRGRGERPARHRPSPEVGADHAWLDHEAGPVVRPYTLTGGRSQPITGGLSLLTHVEALYAPRPTCCTSSPNTGRSSV
jgi:hypothetical protein